MKNLTLAPLSAALLGACLLSPFTSALAQMAEPTTSVAPPKAQPIVADSKTSSKNNWYFSWGYSRQQYAPSDIHVSQPSQGNDFTVHKAAATDFPSSVSDTLSSLINLDLTNPQENVRVGRFMNPEKTFAIEFSLDHTKYNTNIGQTAHVSGTINNQPYNGNMVLDEQNFFYALHNGLNHIMINGVWFHPMRENLQLISRVGAGILLPHADNRIFGKENEVGPKNENICCTSKNDWWQVNGWTAGVEVGFRYTFYKTIYAEATQKFAYGELRGVPVYKGTANQNLWMSEQVFSLGFLF